ncbi:[protein-PII] uridylyltransferase [Acidithrix sp. C25]|uniref:[protein-PII] uridylyltransferase n=1 Tax=Acidithrix sp. C25 TaxID=1671482 RepID=UPI00191BACFA|nr:[protein-PII] uridylyltransferase [Acidithrix sp. C25]
MRTPEARSILLENFLSERAKMRQADWSNPTAMAQLTGISDHFVAGLAEGFQGVAIIAIGGYGRSELAINSDLDILLLHKPRLSVDAMTEALWYTIWDSRVGLDYSVRTVAQALRVAESDPRALLGMLDARLIYGDEVLFRTLQRKIWERFTSRLDRYRVIMHQQGEARRVESGELAFLLEPDIKEAHGGLRDLVILRHFVAADPDRKVFVGRVDEIATLLLRVRNVLQARSDRGQNRLFLQDQDSVSAQLGFRDADELMWRISEAGRFVSRALEESYRVIDAKRVNYKNLGDAWGLIPKGVFSHGGEICIDPASLSDFDAQVIIRIGAASVSLGLGICVDALEICSERLGTIDKPWEPATLTALTTLLSYGEASIAVMERLDHYGLLDKVIPEWKRVRYLPQRNAYHTYTVDRHLIEAGVGAGRLRRNVKRPDLLIVAALLHDIGKGLDRDHSSQGASLAAEIAIRMGLSKKDCEIVVRLVEHHLLLADVATRRDIGDPKTILDVAEKVVDITTLELLRVLTEADSKATGPVAWSLWKEELINKLTEATRAYLDGGSIKVDSNQLGELELDLIAKFDGDLLIHSQGNQIWIAASDEVGLFAKVTGTMALLNLSILSADVFSEGVIALERLRVISPYGREPNWTKFENELRKCLVDPTYLEGRLNEKSKSAAKKRKVAESAKIPPRVTVHDDFSDRATVIEVCGPDGLGTLHRLTFEIASKGLDILHAKVITIGDDVVDTFYVVDSLGRPIDDARLVGEITKSLFDVVVAEGAS